MRAQAYLTLLILLLASCSEKENKPEDPLKAYASSYEIIQGEIWGPNLYQLPAYQDLPFARQSDLILTADVSYAQLINRPPKNTAALEDGLMLVGDKGLESLYESFLWEKINAPDQEHFTQITQAMAHRCLWVGIH